MATESQTVQKSEEELFAEIIEARKTGGDIGAVLKDVEVIGSEAEEVEPTVEETPAGDPPEAKTKEEEKDKKPEQQVAQPAPVDSQEEWMAALSPEIQAKVNALKEESARKERENKALLGRVPFLNRKVDELTKQLSTQRPAEEPAAEKKTSKPESVFAKKLAETRPVDPELADLIEAGIAEATEALRSELAEKTSKTEALFRNKEDEELWRSEKAKLLERIPRADEVFQLELYKEWKQTLPENMRRLAGSIYADEVVIALEQFAKYAQVMQPELIQTPASTTVTTPAVASPEAAKVAASRDRKLAAGNPDTATPRPKAQTKDFDDPEARFNEISKRIREGKSYSDLL
jgi:hypothetical protein